MATPACQVTQQHNIFKQLVCYGNKRTTQCFLVQCSLTGPPPPAQVIQPIKPPKNAAQGDPCLSGDFNRTMPILPPLCMVGHTVHPAAMLPHRVLPSAQAATLTFRLAAHGHPCS